MNISGGAALGIAKLNVVRALNMSLIFYPSVQRTTIEYDKQPYVRQRMLNFSSAIPITMPIRSMNAGKGHKMRQWHRNDIT